MQILSEIRPHLRVLGLVLGSPAPQPGFIIMLGNNLCLELIKMDLHELRVSRAPATKDTFAPAQAISFAVFGHIPALFCMPIPACRLQARTADKYLYFAF